MSANIVYFAHDLADPAVRRRLRMLTVGGATVTPIGFRRGAEPVTSINGVPAIEIGRSVDGRLSQRALLVAIALTKLRGLAPQLRDADVIVARNLEMLVIAAHARRRYAPAARLVYECLDIHRLLLSDGPSGIFLRSLEPRLWRDVDLLLTSSPAFVHNYFVPRQFPGSVAVVENKLLLLADDSSGISAAARPKGPPWRIGWFGMIRCRESLDILSSLACEMQGAVEIVVRGRPSDAVFPDFQQTMADRPHVRYVGPYGQADLADIYGDVHFAWAIDYYESGQNSAWLLPNRIYEGAAYGAVPIGLEGVETATWLKKNAAGVVLHEPLAGELLGFFRSLDQSGYATLVRAVGAVPRSALISDRSDCYDLVSKLCRPLDELVGAASFDSTKTVAIDPTPDSSGARQ